MESFHEAWDLICDYCKAHITDVAYKTWISRIEPVKLDFDAGDAILMVPNEFHRQTLNRCYMPLLNSAVHEIFGSGINIIFTIPNEAGEKKAAPNDNLAIDSEYEFTFDTYIVGSSNKFAHAASLAVAANPAGAYNPLFIYGNSGLGKTHLLYAICNDLKRSHPEMTTLYIKGDDFTNELIDAIQHGTTSTFHQKYRKTDVLLVDDIQFIAGKDSTQEEFFHTFNSLYEAKKQIVLTSDRPPKEIQTLEDRLRTRFEWGLIADIQPPGLPIQRQKPDADKHQRRRDQVALLQLLVKQQGAAKRHEQHVDRRQKRILARRRILQTDGLHDICPEERQPDQRAARHVPARQSPQTLTKQRARDHRRNQIAHGDNRPRRKAVQRVFHHRKRAAPNQRRQ